MPSLIVKRSIEALATVSLLVLLLSAALTSSIEAADVTNRYIELDDSAASVTTVHRFGFDIVSATDIGSIAFEYCANSPLDDDPCVAPPGLNVSAANLDTQLGETGFVIDTNTTGNRIVLGRIAATPTPGSVQYVFSNILNPDTVGSQYVRIYTYLSSDGTGNYTDRGGLAFAITDRVVVEAYVPPVLIFCVGTTITGTDCNSASGNNLDLGVLSPTGASTGTTQMAAGTNGVGGYSISVLGTTMTSGNNIIAPLNTLGISNLGTEQFGMNLVANTAPLVGQGTAGPGTGSPSFDYRQANQFKFANGDIVAGSTLPSDMTKYTVSYIANVTDDQKAGFYSATLTYVCLAAF